MNEKKFYFEDSFVLLLLLLLLLLFSFVFDCLAEVLLKMKRTSQSMASRFSSIFLVIKICFGERNDMEFYRRRGQASLGTKIRMVSVNSTTDCLGICLYTKYCLSFNACESDSGNYCELLSLNRCGVKMKVISNCSIYFSTETCKFQLGIIGYAGCIGLLHGSKLVVETDGKSCVTFTMKEDLKLKYDNECLKPEGNYIKLTDDCNGDVGYKFQGSEENMMIQHIATSTCIQWYMDFDAGMKKMLKNSGTCAPVHKTLFSLKPMD